MKLSNLPKDAIVGQLIEIGNNFDYTKENYLISYPHFLNYFKNLEEIKLENLIIGISFTYSWMPTILKSINLSRVEETITILNRARKEELLNKSELLVLKSNFNNSLVGTSKLLHFINPEKYAIWDSRVYRFLYKDIEPHKYRLEKPETYIEYLNFINSMKEEKDFDRFYKLMKEKVGFEITKNRALELAFFKGIKNE